MSNQILVPSLGESVTEATVSKWLKQVGEQVDVDEPLVELETDKVNVEVPSPTQGTLTDIKVQTGETVEVGAVLGVIGDQTKNIVSISKKRKKETKKVDETIDDKNVPLNFDNEDKEISEEKNKFEKNQSNIDNKKLILTQLAEEQDILVLNKFVKDSNIAEEDSTLILNKPINKKEDTKVKEILSPSVRKIVQEKNIDISNIKGTGKDGRLLKADLISLMGNVPEVSPRRKTHGLEEKVKMTKLRVTIAKRLKEAQNNAAMLTTFNEVDMSSVIQMRKDFQEDFQKKYNVKLGFMSFFVKSCVMALKNFPAINAEVEEDDIIYKNYYNIGIAVGTDRGLVVPVLKKADELSFAEIEKNISLLSTKARNGKITIDDLQGGTFTISNGGIYGSMLSTPILNPPQSGVLGMHNIVERPIVENGNIVVKPIMYLALSYDHRIVDGKEAVSFLKFIKDSTEDPQRLFLDL